jgi:predicted HicB family RNase H-like nuclease
VRAVFYRPHPAKEVDKGAVKSLRRFLVEAASVLDEDYMKYKNYEASVSYDEDARIFHGEVLHLRDVITFQGESVNELEQAFHDSVDDYLEFCKERGEKPEKPYSGKLLLRLDPELHKKITSVAYKRNLSVNSLVAEVLEQYTAERE